MSPAQRIPDRLGHRVDIDALAAIEYLANPYRADAVLAFQPALPLFVVDRHELFGDAVAEVEQSRGDAFDHADPLGRGNGQCLQFGEDQLGHALLPEPVGADKGIGRHPLPGQASGESHRGKRSSNVRGGKVVAQGA